MSEQSPPLDIATYAGGHSGKVAVVMAGSGETIDYRTLYCRSNQLARVFAEAGCEVGDHVAFLLESQIRFSEVCWAAHRSGLHYTPVNTQLTLAEVAFVINDCGAKVVVTSQRQHEVAKDLPASCPAVATWLVMDGHIDGFDSYEAALDRTDLGPLAFETEGSAMLYSSGTTGRPKGIKRPLSGNPVGSSLFGVDVSVARSLGLGGESIALIPLPLYHSSGLTRLMMTEGMGGTVVLMEKFDAVGALAAIETFGVTQGLWVATMFIRLLRLDEEVRSSYDLSSMTETTVGSGPCAPAVKEAIIRWWGPIVTESYGGTEGMGMTRITSEEALQRPGSVGRPVFGELHIIKEDGSEAAPNETGVIYFSGGRPFEYYNDPGKTASVHNERGWNTLGDVGHLDADGYLFITGRETDVVISGGVNIYPQEIEDVMIQLPDIDDVAVVGVPNDEFGEEVKAIVTLRPGAVAGPDFEANLIGACRQQLAGYKCPRSIDIVDDLPRKESGKLYKRLLRERYWSETARGT